MKTNQAIFELGRADAEIQRVMSSVKIEDRKALRRARACIQRALNYIAPNTD